MSHICTNLCSINPSITTHRSKFIKPSKHKLLQERNISINPVWQQPRWSIKTVQQPIALQLPWTQWTCQQPLLNPDLHGSPMWIVYSTLATFQPSRRKCSLALCSQKAGTHCSTHKYHSNKYIRKRPPQEFVV